MDNPVAPVKKSSSKSDVAPVVKVEKSGRYAVVVDGGRQYTVREGDELEIDFRHVTAGSEVVFETVLAVRDAEKLTVGMPIVKGATVKALVLGLVQGEKIFVQKFRRRKNYRRRTGYRGIATRIRIASFAV